MDPFLEDGKLDEIKSGSLAMAIHESEQIILN
jgi:hypothetical protein